MTNPTAKATARPWRCTGPTGKNMRDNYSQPFGIASADDFGTLIAGCFGDTDGGKEASEANAALIVRAVNTHEALVAALGRSEQYLMLAAHDCREAKKFDLAKIAERDLEMVRAALKAATE